MLVALGLPFVVFALLGLCEAWDLVVAGFPGGCREIPRSAFAATAEAQRSLPLIRDATGAKLDVAMNPLTTDRGDAFADHVDHAADGARTIKQSPGAVQDLDPMRLSRDVLAEA